MSVSPTQPTSREAIGARNVTKVQIKIKNEERRVKNFTEYVEEQKKKSPAIPRYSLSVAFATVEELNG